MNRSFRPRPALTAGLIVLPGLALAALIGLLIAGNTGLLLLAIFLTALVVPATYFAGRSFSDRSGWLLVAGWVVMLIAHSVQSTTEFPVGYAHELILFGLALVIAHRMWDLIGNDTVFKAVLVLWLLYILISVLSSLLGRSQLLPAFWQLQYNMKWPLMFGLGTLVIWGDRPERQLRRIILFSWLVLGACMALEFLAPGAHQTVFGPAPDTHQNPLLGFGMRFRGPFSHSGYLALTAGFLAASAVAQTLAGRSRAWLLVAALYITIVLLAGQRQELIALILTLLVFASIHYHRYWYLLLMLGVMAMATAFISMSLLQQIPMREMLEQSGLLPSMTPYAERTILTMKGTSVASQFFPLGSGLGTYGGVGAMKYDQSLFLELGFMQYWWYRQGLFLVDTFWPSIIAESGFFGASLLLIVFATAWTTLVRRTIRSQSSPLYSVSLTALAAMTLMLANSPSSAALTDPRSCFLFWLLVGTAWKATSPVISRARVLERTASVRQKRATHAS